MERAKFVEEVAQKMRNSMCDLFVGSGISAPSGLPTWSDFLSPYLEEIGVQITDESNLPLIAQYIVNNNSGNRNIISDAVYNTFGKEYPLNKYHKIISNFPIRTIWTTNYDNLLEQAFSDRHTRVITSEEALLHPHDNADVEIVKLHGCAKTAAQGIVLTREDYDCFLYNKPMLSQRLREAFINKNILFLGYSYNDPNIHTIMTQAYRMMCEMKKVHYILLCDIEKHDAESESQFESRKRRFHLWIAELNRIGIRDLVVPHYSQMIDVLEEIDKASHDACVFVTGSHTADAEALEYAQLIGQTLAKIPQVVLNSGQSSGVGNATLSSFMKITIDQKQDINKRIHIFPNPYAISPAYSNDPSLIPDLKLARVPLITNSTLIIAFPGGIGTTAEIEVAYSKGRLVFPVLWDAKQYDSQAIKIILENEDNMNRIKEMAENYYNILIKREKPSKKEITAAICEVIHGKT